MLSGPDLSILWRWPGQIASYLAKHLALLALAPEPLTFTPEHQALTNGVLTPGVMGGTLPPALLTLGAVRRTLPHVRGTLPQVFWSQIAALAALSHLLSGWPPVRGDLPLLLCFMPSAQGPLEAVLRSVAAVLCFSPTCREVLRVHTENRIVIGEYYRAGGDVKRV